MMRPQFCPPSREMRRPIGLGGQQQALRNSETVLLVDHREPQVPVGDLLLEDGVRSNEDIDRPVGQAHQHGLPRLALLAAGQDRNSHSDAVELAEQGRMMLPCEDLGRRQQGGLRSGLDRRQHSHQRYERLSRADVALQQPQHRRGLRHVAADFVDHSPLRARELVRQLQLADQLARSGQGDATLPAGRLAEKHQRKLVGENLVIGEPPSRIVATRIAVRLCDSAPPRPPRLAAEQARLDPLRQVGRAFQRCSREFA